MNKENVIQRITFRSELEAFDSSLEFSYDNLRKIIFLTILVGCTENKDSTSTDTSTTQDTYSESSSEPTPTIWSGAKMTFTKEDLPITPIRTKTPSPIWSYWRRPNQGVAINIVEESSAGPETPSEPNGPGTTDDIDSLEFEPKSAAGDQMREIPDKALVLHLPKKTSIPMSPSWAGLWCQRRRRI